MSPAVIVPCLFRLRGKGYGVSKGIPTLVLAVSGVDDAASVAVFGIVSSIMFSGSSITYNIIQVCSYDRCKTLTEWWPRIGKISALPAARWVDDMGNIIIDDIGNKDRVVDMEKMEETIP